MSNLEECFRNFNENKVTKYNVWQNHFIDDFKDIIANHHNTLGNFPLVGSMLEASSHIYGMKVDTVHTDVLRMCTGVNREQILENSNNSVAPKTTSVVPPKKATTRRRAHTIIGNKELINAPLELIEEPNSTFSKLNSSIGIGLSTKNLLQNVLPSHQYELSLNTKTKFWNNQNGMVSEMVGSAVSEEACVELPILNWEPTNNDVVRPKLTGYEISNAPHENNWKSAIIESQLEIMDHSELIETSHSIASSIEYQFDIHADVEKSLNPHLHSVLSGIAMDNFTQDDQNALARCSGLRREGISIDDLRPCDASVPSEYSYRRLNLAKNQVWAGPSYWKVPPTKQKNNSRRRPIRRPIRKRIKNLPIKLSAVCKENIDRCFILLHDENISIRNACIAKWDQQKLKLPHDFKCDMNRFSFLSLAPGIFIDAEICSEDSTIDSMVPHDLSSNSHLSAFGRGGDLIVETNELFDDWEVPLMPGSTTDVEIDINDVAADVPNIPESTIIQDIDMNVTTGAPFEQLNVPNINPGRSIDMKQLKVVGLRIIQAGARTFSNVYKELEKFFGNEVITPGVVFSTILQLANENQFHLKKIDGNDFEINYYNNSRN